MDDLDQFSVPSGNHWQLRLAETQQTLVGGPRSIMRMAVISTLIPWTGVAWMTWHEGPGWCEGFGLPWYFIFALAVLATAVTLGIVYAMNQRMLAYGEWFVLDKIPRTLALPRSGVVLKADDIRQIVELYGWWQGIVEKVRLCEISVVASGDGEELLRFPVAQADLTTGPRIAKTLAESLRVPRIVITHPFFGSAEPQVTIVDIDSDSDR